MRLAPRPLIVDKTEGFSERNDTFGARRSAERFAKLVADLEGHAVIVLDGDWGSGKSTFVKQWAGMMRNRNHVVVEFDAFEADHHKDAFFSLLTALLHEVGDSRASDGSESVAWRRRLKNAAIGVVRTSPGIMARATLPGPVGVILAEAIRHTMDRSSEPTGDATVADRLLAEHIDTIAAERSAVHTFRDELSAVVRQISESSQASSPLIFVIDELDRCKPSFALDVLERMKHVFASHGVCFVLVTHLAELQKMVRHAYGIGNAEQYLHKFYQLKIDIGQLLSREGMEVSGEYIRYLCAEFGLPRPDHDHTWFVVMASLVRLYGLTLRSVERVVRNFAMYARTNRNYPVVKLMEIAAGLCVMREVEPDLYETAGEGRLTFRRVEEFLRLGEWEVGWGGDELKITWQEVTREHSLPLERAEDESPALLGTADGGQRMVTMSQVVRRICNDIDLFAQSG